jgi:Protein of unknown function (DUF732)
MKPLRRTITVAILACGLAVFGGATPAQADADDQRFADAVAALGIPVGPNEDLPLVGQRVCEMLTGGLTGNANPVPVVRGVANQLANSGMSREQAVGLMRAAVGVYCPEHTRFMGR